MIHCLGTHTTADWLIVDQALSLFCPQQWYLSQTSLQSSAAIWLRSSQWNVGKVMYAMFRPGHQTFEEIYHTPSLCPQIWIKCRKLREGLWCPGEQEWLDKRSLSPWMTLWNKLPLCHCFPIYSRQRCEWGINFNCVKPWNSWVVC